MDKKLEVEIGEWLEVLDLGDFSYQQFKNSEMFLDPYRNGILFAKPSVYAGSDRPGTVFSGTNFQW